MLMRSILVLSLLAPLGVAQRATPVENDQVRVLVVDQQPHAKTAMHEHKENRVMIYLNAGHQDIISQNGKKTVLNFKPGEVLWSPVSGMHTAEITSSGAVKIVEVELRKPGSGKTVTTPLDPVKIDKKHYKVEFENPQVRVVRAKIGAGESAPMHEHQLDRVVVYMTDQKNSVKTPDGKVNVVERKAGEVAWAGQAKHMETNVGDKPFEVLVVELK